MKMTHKLCGAALLAAVGLAVVVPQGAKANELTGSARIQFTSTSSSTTPPTNPSGGSNTGSGELPTTSGGGGTTTDAEGFGISYITDLDFGSHSAVAGQAEATYWAQNWVGKNAANETMENANFVNFEDIRQTTNHSYKIEAELTKQFTGAVDGVEVELNGATITYTKPKVQAQAGYEASQLPLGAQTDVTLALNSKQVMLDNTTASTAVYENGFGKFTLLYGTYGTDADQAIQLSLPNRSVYETEYKAGITWSMTVAYQP